MPNKDRIDEIIDKAAIEKQIKYLDGSLTELVNKIQAFPKIKSLFENAGDWKQYNAAQKEALKTQEEVSGASKKVQTEQAKLAQLYTQEAKAIAELNIKQQQRRQELKNEAKEATGLVSAYDKLSKQLNESRKAYKDLAAQGRANSSEAKSLLKDVTALDNQLKKIDATTGQHQRNVGNYTSVLDKLGNTFSNVGQRILAYLSIYAILNAVKDFFTGSLNAALEADRAAHVLKGTLDNIGRSDAFDRIKGKAIELMERFKIFDDEEILGVFNKLIIYGKLTESQIDALMPKIINFAAQSGRSLEESATIVIRAIEGNGKALKEFGIDIKDAKTESERLALVMDELGKRVEGAADAFGESAQGKIAATKIRLSELKEEIGEKLIPIWSKLLNVVNEFLGAINKVATQSFSKTIENTFRRFSAFGRGGFGGLSDERKAIEDEESRQGIEDKNSKNVFIQPADTIVGKEKVLGLGGGLDTVDESKRQEAIKKREQELAASIKRAEEFRRRELEEIRKANADKAQILKDGYKAQADDEELSYAARFLALRLYNEAGIKLIQQTKKDETAILQNELSEAKKNAKTKQELTAITDYGKAKENAIIQKADQDLAKLQTETSNQTTKLTIENFEKISAAGKKAYQEVADAITTASKNNQHKITIDKDDRLLQLDKDVQRGKIKNLQEYNAKKEIIEKEASVKTIENEIETLKTREKLFGVTLETTASIKDKEVELNRIKNAKILADEEQHQKNIQKLQDLALEAVQAFVSGSFDKQKNAIQEEINLLSERTKREIDSVNASVASEEDKANRISIIQARSNAKKEQLERRQKDLEIQRAKFEKAFAILEIGITTARAVMALSGAAAKANLAVPGSGFAFLAQIPWQLAFGALQIAAVAAKPIPKFAKGTDNAPAGLVIVGEEEREMVIPRSGQPYLTPAGPTLMQMAGGEKIIPANITKDLLMANNLLHILQRAQTTPQAVPVFEKFDFDSQRRTEYSKQQLRTLERIEGAIKNQDSSPKYEGSAEWYYHFKH